MPITQVEINKCISNQIHFFYTDDSNLTAIINCTVESGNEQKKNCCFLRISAVNKLVKKTFIKGALCEDALLQQKGAAFFVKTCGEMLALGST